MRTTTDKAGRVVVPQPLCEQWQVGPGQEMEIRSPQDAASSCTISLSAYADMYRGIRTFVLFDDELAAEARELGINVSEAARAGIHQAIRGRRAERDRAASLAHPETEDANWDGVESWGEA